MIISGGKYRGHKIRTPKSNDVRPTSSKVRESIFNILQSLTDNLPNSVVLDLFAGSGIMGIEFLSRGAKKAVFVEKNPAVARLVRDNLRKYEDAYEIIQSDAQRVLKRLGGQKFDIIFIDPPYHKGFYEDVLNLISKSHMLANQGILIIEGHAGYDLSEVIEKKGFEITKSKKYGDTAIYFAVNK